MVRINGSHGEGGSALFRTALACSVLTAQPVQVRDVRGATRKPGVTSEDLTVLRALAAVTDATVSGDELGSQTVEFSPRRGMRSLRTTLDIGAFEKGQVSGSALVVAQAILPVLARVGSYSELTILGETHSAGTLSFDAFERGVLPAVRHCGLGAWATMNRAGFGMGQRGEVRLEVEPSALTGLIWERRGERLGVSCVVSSAEIQDTVLERAEAFTGALGADAGLEIDFEDVRVPSREAGLMVTFVGEYERGMGTATVMGRRGVRVEEVLNQAWGAYRQWEESGATTDPYLADQILLTAVMGEGPTVFTTSEVTRRLTTMVWVIKQFLPIGLMVKGVEGGPGTVTVSR